MAQLSSSIVWRFVLATLLVAATVEGMSGLETFWDGGYTDPNHDGCPRHIKVHGETAEVTGADGFDMPACPEGKPTTPWKLEGRIEDKTILVDFSPKGGPKDLLGKWVGDGIVWPDGNKWSKIPCADEATCSNTVV